MAHTYKASNPLSTTQKSLKIVDVLKEIGPATVTELANQTKMSKGTVHHHLSTLAEFGYVVNEDGSYDLGLKFLDIGGKIRQRRGFYCHARTEIDKAANQCGEFGQVMVEEQGEGVHLYHTTGYNGVEIDTYSGRRVPLYCSALGKSVLAHLPSDKRENIINSTNMSEFTEDTITDREKLNGKLDKIRKYGYALENEEFIPRISGVAVPIISSSGLVYGAIGFSGPTDRFNNEQWIGFLLNLLFNARDYIENKLNLWHNHEAASQVP